MTSQTSTGGRTQVNTAGAGSATPAATALPRTTATQIWAELGKASFAIIGYSTPAGEPRSCGVVYALDGGHLYVAVAPDGWKARHITEGQQVAITVPIRRGGLLSLLFPIPPATISFHATTMVHPAGSLDVASMPKKLASSCRRNDVPERCSSSCRRAVF